MRGLEDLVLLGVLGAGAEPLLLLDAVLVHAAGQVAAGQVLLAGAFLAASGTHAAFRSLAPQAGNLGGRGLARYNPISTKGALLAVSLELFDDRCGRRVREEGKVRPVRRLGPDGRVADRLPGPLRAAAPRAGVGGHRRLRRRRRSTATPAWGWSARSSTRACSAKSWPATPRSATSATRRPAPASCATPSRCCGSTRWAPSPSPTTAT